MLQSTSNSVWGYGRGMARTVARTTRGTGAPDETTTEGAMNFAYQGPGEWLVTFDVAGVTEIRYLAARILQGGGAPDIQAMICIVPGTGGKQATVSLRDASAGNPAPPAEIPEDGALVVDVITDQTGDIRFSYGPQIPPPDTIPPPAPRPPTREVIL